MIANLFAAIQNRRRYLHLFFVLLLAAWLGLATSATAELMVIAAAGGGTEDRGMLLVLDTATGLRTALSDFGNPAQGTVGMNMRRICLVDGDLVVADPFVGLLFRVDPTTGQREVLSDFNDEGQGPPDGSIHGVAPGPGGSILVTAFSSLYKVDRFTGQRTVLSDFNNPAQGPGEFPLDVTTNDGTGRILVSDQAGGQGKVLVVDPVTGNRSVLSDFNNPAQGESLPISSVAADPEYGLFAVSTIGNKIFHVDGVTGQRTLVANFSDPAHGTVWDFRPLTLEIDSNGLLLVVGISVTIGGFDMVIAVDPATTNRVLLSELSSAQQGATASAPTGIVSLVGRLFTDGFESGDLLDWSSAVGAQ